MISKSAQLSQIRPHDLNKHEDQMHLRFFKELIQQLLIKIITFWQQCVYLATKAHWCVYLIKGCIRNGTRPLKALSSFTWSQYYGFIFTLLGLWFVSFWISTWRSRNGKTLIRIRRTVTATYHWWGRNTMITLKNIHVLSIVILHLWSRIGPCRSLSIHYPS